jgi:FkbM family methyltransferase
MRSLSAYQRNLAQAHRYAGWFGAVFMRFRQPFGFLAHYVRRSVPRRGMVAMRDGTRIYLSGHAHDVITVFVIFVRQDYGRLASADTVVDIGANIGAFALFAARQGANKVIAFEPNSAAHACLRRNVAENGLEGIVHARRLAVTAVAGQSVRFPVAPSPYNRIAGQNEDGGETVETTSLARIIATEAPGGIDLLKLDCEGGEYDILFASDAPLHQVHAIRMEYHCGRGGELADFLTSRGFRITRMQPEGPLTGMLWARRAPSTP